MDRQQVVGVEASGRPASGYAVGRRLVLTSAHAVAGGTGGGPSAVGLPARVFRPGKAGIFDAVVVWCGTVGGRADAALLRVDGLAWTPSPPVRWGRLVTDRTGVECKAWGLPEYAQREGWPAQVEQVSGWLNPGSGYVANRHVMTVREPPPERAELPSPWGGMSGGAVFCGPLLTGVVQADRAHSGGTQLVLSPAYALHHEQGFREALTAYDVPPAELEPVELHELADLAAHPERYGAPKRSPAALLHADRRIVPFHGRTGLLAELAQWCAPAGFDVALVHGPAGQGKTRLAHELALRLAGDGWAVLWPKPEASTEDLRALRDLTKPLLVVLDYAESRSAQVLGLVAAAADQSGSQPFKVLLVARARGDWWERELHSRVGEYLDGAPEWRLDGLEDDEAAARPHAYRVALERFAAALAGMSGYAGPDWAALAAARPAPDGLDHPRNGNPLTLHMTALADLLDAARPGPRGQVVRLVEDRLLVHERNYWWPSADTRGLRAALSEQTLQAALAAVHLTGAADLGQARELWRRIPALADQPTDLRDRVTRWLAELYPALPPQPFSTLQPDRLAERHVALVLLNDPGLADNLLDGANRAQREQLLTVYARSAADPVLDGRLDRHLTKLCVSHHRRLAEAVVATATRLARPEPLIAALTAVIEDPTTPLADLRALHDLFPGSSLTLVHTAVRLGRRIAERCRLSAVTDPATYTPVLAMALLRLAESLGEAGLQPEAVDVAREAAELHRGLAEDDPEQYLSRLALSLGALSRMLLELGRSEESLPILREAVAVSRGLIEPEGSDLLLDAVAPTGPISARPVDVQLSQATREAVGRFRLRAGTDPKLLPHLALMLLLLAASLSDAGRHAEAATTAQEVVDRLVGQSEQDGTTLMLLALALGALSGLGGEADRGADAANTALDAVDLLRAAAGRNEADALALAVALTGLSRAMSAAGRHDEAVALADEAAEWLRRHVEDDPDTHLKYVAQGLHNLAVQQSELGERDAALATAAESVQHHRTLAEPGSGAHQWGLATSLVTLAKTLADTGRWAECQDAGREAAALCRDLMDREPTDDLFVFGLATALLSEAQGLRSMGRTAEAQVVVEQAVALCRTLSAESPNARYRLLPEALALLSGDLCSLGEWEAAESAGREAVAIGRKLAGQLPAGRLPASTVGLLGLFSALDETGQAEEALQVIEEAVRDYRSVDVAPGGLAMALALKAKGLAALGRWDEAATVGEEAVARSRTLAERHPRAHQLGLCLALNLQSLSLDNLKRWSESVELARESVTCARRQPADAGFFQIQLALGLNNLASGLTELGRYEEGLAAAEEAVSHYREMAGRLPRVYTPGLTAALCNLACALEQAGRTEEAAAVVDEAVARCRWLVERLSPGHRPLLVAATDGLVSVLELLGRREEARAARAERIGHLRLLAVDTPAAWLPSLVRALDDSADELLAAGRPEKALVDLREATTLAGSLPDRYSELIGTLLNRLAALLAKSAHWEEARVQSEAAVEHWRAAAAGENEHLAQLGLALTVLSGVLTVLGRWQEGLTAGEEAIGYLRATSSEEASSATLAMALTAIVAPLARLSRWDAALAAGEEAVDRLRAADDQGAGAASLLGAALVSLATPLAGLGRPEDAFAVTGEGIALLRNVAADHPAFNPMMLAEALATRTHQLAGLERWQDVLTVGQEAVESLRSLFVAASTVHRPMLAYALVPLGRALGEAGRWAEAVEHWEEAAEHLDELAENQPELFLTSLAEVAGLRSGGLLAIGRPDEARVMSRSALKRIRALDGEDSVHRPASLAVGWSMVALVLNQQDRSGETADALREAVALRRDPAEQEPDQYLPVLAESLLFLAVALAESDREPEAVVAGQETCELGRMLFAADPVGRLPFLAMALAQQVSLFTVTDRWAEAADLAEEHVSHSRALAAADPASLPDLANALFMLGLSRYAADRTGEAVAPLREAVAHLRVLVEDDPEAFSEAYQDAIELLDEVEAEG
ncbi:hypothetical protein ACH4S8_44515 [Streptomyces sp. NPDC021080]|uniref:P-loop NTPase n=1 Tax=Streptomyces sp. NPDC021080 TaxID=3365110 RepID=UPI00378BD2C3